VSPGLTIPASSTEGYKGVDPPRRCSTAPDRWRQILGDKRGGGFAQMMDGVEVAGERVRPRLWHRDPGVELAIDYAQSRQTFGKPIAQHQAIAFKLAEMGTKVEAAHLMMVNAAR